MPITTPFPHPDLLLVIEAALAASKPILEIYAQEIAVEFKAGEEPVTLADKAANEVIVQHLRAAFPGDTLLTEEGGLALPEIAVTGRVWFVDPIDGTKEFIKKNGEFAVQIACADQQGLSLGLIYQPATCDLYVGARGQGCHHCQGQGPWRRMTVSPKPPHSLIVAMSRSHPSSLAKKAGTPLGLNGEFRCGGVGLKLMAMVAGRAHYYLNDSNSTKAWDIAAPELLFREAGGHVSDLRGVPFAYDPRQPFHHHGLLASTCADLHQALIAQASPLLEAKAQRQVRNGS